MSPIKLPTKRVVFPNFHISKINRMMLFRNLFMERPSYNITQCMHKARLNIT